MAHTKSAKKRLITNSKRRQRNRYWRSTMRTAIKKYAQMVESGELDKAQQALPALTKVIDKVKSKGVIKKSEASRRVSRMAKMLNRFKNEQSSKE